MREILNVGDIFSFKTPYEIRKDVLVEGEQPILEYLRQNPNAKRTDDRYANHNITETIKIGNSTSINYIVLDATYNVAIKSLTITAGDSSKCGSQLINSIIKFDYRLGVEDNNDADVNILSRGNIYSEQKTPVFVKQPDNNSGLSTNERAKIAASLEGWRANKNGDFQMIKSGRIVDIIDSISTSYPDGWITLCYVAEIVIPDEFSEEQISKFNIITASKKTIL